ncbi:peroxiredoxin family protein [Pseudalkalibacillus caeni]|uniref:Redoxin domain-containing protein n=1 Tax=Exobacillus caeni TaxID=2574798 RepID=A0A5R9FB73_9BACL|nr:redoxin domain-containing protein [Pseudalkalibacillus caeni]TLS38133.1 redoxin domain-containing protein [Pseudalkalibacillus caeni]
MKKIIVLLLAAALAWGIYSAFFQERAVGIEEGNIAPDFSLTTLSGEKASLSDFKGKPVLLNFWATWCPPCKKEMPDMQKFYEKHGSEAAIVSVNMTKFELPDRREKVKDFVEDYQLTFPVLLDLKGEVGEKTYNVITMPTTFLIDSEGVIKEKVIGPMTYKKMEESIDRLD